MLTFMIVYVYMVAFYDELIVNCCSYENFDGSDTSG